MRTFFRANAEAADREGGLKRIIWNATKDMADIANYANKFITEIMTSGYAKGRTLGRKG